MATRRRTSGANQAMFKLIMVGDSGTGKSCLLVRYIKDEFNEQYNVTVGVQFASKKLDIDENYKIKLQIWDTAGQQSFRSIVKSFYRNSAAVILVYDITKKKSFENLKSWFDEAKQNAPKTSMYVLMGTHLDLQDQREVSKEEAQKWMQEQQIVMFFETSAKTALNVSKAFDEVAKQLFMNQLQKRRQSLSPLKNTIQIQTGGSSPANNEKSSCC